MAQPTAASLRADLVLSQCEHRRFRCLQERAACERGAGRKELEHIFES
jgi:hypothetical protein